MRVQRKRILLIAVFALIACGLGLVLYISHEPPEPVYRGKPLSYWLEGYDWQIFPPLRPTAWEADDAIRRMGTNAFPRLLQMLQARDSNPKTKIMALLQRQHWFQISFEPADKRNLKALAAIEHLGPSASNAVPRLIKIFDSDPNPFPQQAVPAILACIGPSARQAVPELLRGMTHTNWIVRYNSTIAIHEIHPDPNMVVPALIKLLDDPNHFVRREAAGALGSFGSDARAAVPALLKLAAEEPDNSFATWFIEGVFVTGTWEPSAGMSPTHYPAVARDALWSIDPKAAAKVAKK